MLLHLQSPADTATADAARKTPSSEQLATLLRLQAPTCLRDVASESPCRTGRGGWPGRAAATRSPRAEGAGVRGDAGLGRQWCRGKAWNDWNEARVATTPLDHAIGSHPPLGVLCAGAGVAGPGLLVFLLRRCDASFVDRESYRLKALQACRPKGGRAHMPVPCRQPAADGARAGTVKSFLALHKRVYMPLWPSIDVGICYCSTHCLRGRGCGSGMHDRCCRRQQEWRLVAPQSAHGTHGP